MPATDGLTVHASIKAPLVCSRCTGFTPTAGGAADLHARPTLRNPGTIVISTELRNHIDAQLREIALQKDVRVLYAAESGSRASASRAV